MITSYIYLQLTVCKHTCSKHALELVKMTVLFSFFGIRIQTMREITTTSIAGALYRPPHQFVLGGPQQPIGSHGIVTYCTVRLRLLITHDFIKSLQQLLTGRISSPATPRSRS